MCRHNAGKYASNAGDSVRPLPSALRIETLPARAAETRPAMPSDESLRSASGSQNESSVRRRITSTRDNPLSVFRYT